MWGTDAKGSLLKPRDRADEKVLDVPHRVDGASLGSFYFAGGAGGGEDGASASAPATLQDDSAAATTLSRVVCGASATAFLLSDGSCYVSGENKYGQLGVGHKDPVAIPAPLVLPPPMKTDNSGDSTSTDENGGSSSAGERPAVSDLALGPAFSAAVDADGNLYTCGLGGSVVAGFGMLGHGSPDSIAEFRQVESLVEDQCRVKQVQVGESHMVVLTTEGEVSSGEGEA